MLKVLELFSGIGCQTQALKNIGIEHQSTQCEIDKYAESIYNQIHGNTENLGDITKVDENTLSEGQWDLITYSFPCTNISVAGQQEGLEKNSGTASSLLWECERIIQKVKPTYLLMENVKNLLSKKHIHNFEEWLKILEDMGYTNYYKVLNAKDFGVPQNRERVFCVSILGEHEPYVFPEPRQLNIRLKDILEPIVDAKYYLSEKVQQRFKYKPQGQSIIGTTAPESRSIGQRDIVYNTENTMGALVATDYKQPKQIIEFDMPNGKKAEITNNVNEPNCFKEVRTEQGKLGRKLARQQGLGDITPRDKDSKMFITKNDGVANCLTTTCGVEQIIVQPLKKLVLSAGTIAFVPNGNGSYYHYVFDKDITINLDESIPQEPLIVASRGRYTDKNNPTKTEQCLEINDSGLTNTITTVQKDNYVAEPKLIVHNIVQPVSVRKYEVDIKSLKETLRLAKWNSELTNNQIAESLGIPLTKVEHWFRTDDCFAIPDAELWNQLKELLKIETTAFDESIMTFEEKDGVYEKANRCYDEEGLSPTLTATSSNEKIISNYKIRKLTPRECYRLMGWKDEQFDKIQGISDAQLYKTAGNGIVIPVLEAIFEKMFK